MILLHEYLGLSPGGGGIWILTALGALPISANDHLEAVRETPPMVFPHCLFPSKLLRESMQLLGLQQPIRPHSLHYSTSQKR